MIRDLFPFGDAGELREDERSNFVKANRVEVRHGVCISRISGSVAVGPFDQEMVPAGTHFHGEVALQNYQAWQLGLLGSALAELSDGFAQLGSSKSRGLGVVRVEFLSLTHEQRVDTEAKPLGVGALADEATRRAYGLFAEASLPEGKAIARGLSHRFEAEGAASVDRWIHAGLNALGGLRSVAQGGG